MLETRDDALLDSLEEETDVVLDDDIRLDASDDETLLRKELAMLDCELVREELLLAILEDDREVVEDDDDDGEEDCREEEEEDEQR